MKMVVFTLALLSSDNIFQWNSKHERIKDQDIKSMFSPKKFYVHFFFNSETV